MCSKSIEEKFIQTAKRVLSEWYGENPQASPDLTRIINKHNFLRLRALLGDTKGEIAIGGDSNEDDLYIAPTVVGKEDLI